jgi:DNA-binding NarL/FixJ family response regulator
MASRLPGQQSKAKIVFLTVHEDSDILATCLAAGGLGYVVKLLMDTKLPRNMKTTKMLVSPSTPGRFTTSGMQATVQPHKSKLLR